MTNADAHAPDLGSQAPWRDRAVARSLDGARSRAEERVQRFLDATVELIRENDGLDFTVQDVVARSNQSLRSFYQFFDGKQHLLLAVYEGSMQAASVTLLETLASETDPMQRLRLFVTTLYKWSVADPIEVPPAPHLAVRSMADFLLGLLATDREKARSASAPLFDLLLKLLEEAKESGALTLANPRRSAALILQTTMFNAYSMNVGGDSEAHEASAEEMWAFIVGGIGGRP
ncbi:MAG: TetR/AcrR family transcriptional regulator [Acidimicrobiaceae bacterium]|nr:helix-turn-helix domain containing protein [Acidimicrobiaceae bacterium]MYA74180.1 TetR/AcrR family transcriptional regulator [Acidimicrobiaceae bacterium]MYG55222.1 TetR/AcrR family transcriptional regulator [Acidimicrobiaceae bacterium]MYJ99702.1 TetR/AcrR family transcriptional regulator [Acidimicrobiaceae bacterium]